jgi:hypothetical protein
MAALLDPKWTEPEFDRLKRSLKRGRKPQLLSWKAQYYEFGCVVPQDLRLAQEAGDQELADSLYRKVDVLEREKAAMNPDLQAAVQHGRDGSLSDALASSFGLLYGGYPRSQHDALDLLRQCGERYPDVWGLIGDLVRKGAGVDMNQNKAQRWYHRAHVHGSIRSRAYDWLTGAHRSIYPRKGPGVTLDFHQYDVITEPSNFNGVDRTMMPVVVHFYSEIRSPFVAYVVEIKPKRDGFELNSRSAARLPD